MVRRVVKICSVIMLVAFNGLQASADLSLKEYSPPFACTAAMAETIADTFDKAKQGALALAQFIPYKVSEYDLARLAILTKPIVREIAHAPYEVTDVVRPCQFVLAPEFTAWVDFLYSQGYGFKKEVMSNTLVNENYPERLKALIKLINSETTVWFLNKSSLQQHIPLTWPQAMAMHERLQADLARDLKRDEDRNMPTDLYLEQVLAGTMIGVLMNLVGYLSAR